MLALALLGAVAPSAAHAQSPLAAVGKHAPGKETATDGAVGAVGASASVADLKKRLSETQAELAAIDSPERMAAGAPPGTPTQELQLRVRALRLMAFSYRQQINALGTLAEQKKLAADAEAKRRAWSEPAVTAPRSVLVVDGMRAEAQAALLNLRSEEARAKILTAQSENAKEALAKGSERLRLLQEAVETAKPPDLPAATWRRDLAALEVRAQGVFLESLAAMLQSVEVAVGEYGRALDFSRRKIAEAEKSVVFKADDLQRLKTEIDERRAKVIKLLDSATRDREHLSAEVDKAIAASAAADRLVVDIESRYAEARNAEAAAETELAAARKPEGFLQKINPFRGRSASADLEKRRREAVELNRQLAAARNAAVSRERELLLAIERSRNAAQAVETQNIGLVTLDMQRGFWELRYGVGDSSGQGRVDRRKLAEGGRRLLKVLNPSIQHLRSKLDVLVGQLSEQQGFLRAASDPSEAAFRKAMIALLEEREQFYLAAATEVEEVRHLLMRWLEEEGTRAEGQTAGQRAQNWFGLSHDALKSIWTYELFSVEDSLVVDGKTITGTRGITVAKVVQAILIVVIGYLIVALLTRLLMASAVRRGHLEETSARIARKWVLAVTVVILLLLALDVVKIPLAAFAFLGGAIAIGAGFGMQTLLKNLISGVMLLMERPFKPHDIVEVAGIRGEVTDINVRSCTIRDVNGIETLVPNSTFLEQNVTNWTLSSRKVRFTLNVGVGYGSPVREVSDLLLEVAARHKQVLNDPAPEVLFMDFADNALLFSLYVWLEVGPGRRGGNVVLSDLRFMIEASFKERGIEIPYPQRDLHFDAAAPVPVRVVPPAVDGG